MTNIPVSERVNWLGGSETACILGLSPFASPFEIWHRKARAELPEFVENERVMAGRHLEAAIAKWAAEKWDWEIEPFNEYLTHPSVPRFGASLDWCEAGTRRPVEIKNVDYLVFRDKWEAEGEDIIDAPLHYIIQVQSQLAMLPGVDGGWLLVCVGGNKLYRMWVERHDRTIAKIEREVEAFWQSIDEGREPAPDYNQDAATLAFLYDTAAIGQVVDLRGNNRAVDLCHQYADAAAREKAAAGDKESAKAELVDIIRRATNLKPHDEPGKGRVLLDGFGISMWRVKESDISYTRAAYTGMKITAKKSKES